jgi:hypothetical protein
MPALRLHVESQPLGDPLSVCSPREGEVLVSSGPQIGRARVSAAMPERVRVNPLVQKLSHYWLLPKRKFLRRRLNKTVVEVIAGRSFTVIPDVFNPAIFRTGRYFAEFLATSPLVDPAQFEGDGPVTTLDVGTGCGVMAITAAGRGHLATGVDVSEVAVRCARANVLLNDMEDRVEILGGDLFAPVEGRRFDIVLSSLPKFRGTPGDRADIAWRSERVIDRFAAGLSDKLTPRGFGLVLLTTHGDADGMLDALAAAGMHCEAVARKHFGVEIFTMYKVSPDR